ncbi:MAG: thymidylate kinase, partial [Candidatus Limnocylindria bacterium]
ARIGRPDLTIALRIDAATARARKPNSPDALDAKAAALTGLGEGDARLVVIDAATPLDDVLRRAAIAVWDQLG